MQVALTGASGFAGRHILSALLAAGHNVKTLVRRNLSQFPENVQVVVGDLNDKQALLALTSDCDVIVHCAGAIMATRDDEYFKVNYAGTQNIYAAAQQSGVNRFIQISSLAARMPSISPYAASKRAAEDFLQEQTSNIVILRPSAVYGPGDKATLPLLGALQKNVALVPSKAAARFSLVHVADLAAVVADAVVSTNSGLYEVDDMSGGYSWADVAAVNLKLFGTPRHLTFLPRALVNLVATGAEIGTFFTGLPGMVSRAKVREIYHEDWVVREQNWQRPKPIKLEQGLLETINWYVEQGWLPPPKRKYSKP